MTDSSTSKKIALVTGANKGIGYEIAAGLSRLGFRVAVGARDEGRRTAAVEKLQADGHDVFGVALDVTSDESVAAAAAAIEQEAGRLDVLVNNAAITGGMPQEPTQVSAAQVLEVVDTNVVGVIRVTNAMLPMLRRSASPRIVNVSSTVGSLTLQTAQAEAVGPISAAYSPTKSYLNAITIQYAKELAGTPVLVNAGCPGYVSTDLNNHQGFRTPEQGAAVFLELATLPDGGPSGTFRDETGLQPW
ncbi:NAD(P)-dependent dehydrogenase, short-chain alcohol dehydrogenase family [Nocardioides exalbidus]|uniref:NAD(P)-dependent dehydrogenase, short-chain alcohol dehydrogenase family n=1 Tax=Nocardioides exalbidus TaxID=402596 RepID=A0A1H4WZY0_9ACTN|nr:SDR family oxidoreductase [Nocardioides exalbidus]SEC98805.1 NAD(P)-dependent dehydrogenase, short-chain alcohol dehydrogenase family [Nocardioides exalbidus]